MIINIEDIRHGVRVANQSLKLATLIGFKKNFKDNIYISSLFHDIGKAYLSQKILNKPGKLSDSEKKHINNHPIYSYNEVLNLGYSNEIALNILHHHENFNGTGYPNGLKGEDIPIGARIIKICDVFDALTMDRPYRKKLSIKKALEIMIAEKEHYDNKLLKVFIE